MGDFSLFYILILISLLVPGGMGIVVSGNDVTVNQVPQAGEITASIHVDGDPVGMDISLDGVPSGVVGGNGVLDIAAVPVGEHLLTAAKEGYVAEEIPVTVGDGLPTEVRITLVPEKTGSLSVTSVPDKVQVYIDDRYNGVTPVTVNGILVGNHTVTLKLAGYRDWTGEVAVTGDAPVSVEGIMTRTGSEPGPVQTQQSPSGQVLLPALLVSLVLLLVSRRD